MIIDKCPHCNTSYVQTSKVYEDNFHPSSSKIVWGIIRCQNQACKKLVLVIETDGTRRIHPPASFDLDPKIVIDDEIRNDFQEAGLCLGAGCNKASMVMSRRTFQRILKAQGCPQKKLVAAIDHAIKENILRPQFHALANEIREYGNLGAHPDDQLKNVTADTAKQVLEFVRVLIDEFYELPAKVDGLRKKRESAAEDESE